jgi:hypothetical protein
MLFLSFVCPVEPLRRRLLIRKHPLSHLLVPHSAWPVPQEPQPQYSHGWKGVFKGRVKREAQREERERIVADNMKKMAGMVAAYREERRNRSKSLSVLDQVILSPRMQREKARRNRALQMGGY